MKQPRHMVAEAIAKRTLHLGNPKDLAREIAAYLLLEGRVTDLEPLMRDIVAYRAEHGIVEADVVSAHELDDVDIKDVKAILKKYYPKADHVTINQKLDPGVIGGVKLVMPHEQLDDSVRSQLSKFKYLTTSERA